MVDRSTAPLEMFGEPDDTECPHGIPTGMGVECWECRYDQLKIDYDALEQECGELAERLQKLAAEIAEPSIKELDTLHRIRKAVGDTGKMMQDELVDKIQEIVSENATLRKRLEDFGKFWEWSRLTDKYNFCDDAGISFEAMEIKEGDNANSSHILG